MKRCSRFRAEFVPIPITGCYEGIDASEPVLLAQLWRIPVSQRCQKRNNPVTVASEFSLHLTELSLKLLGHRDGLEQRGSLADGLLILGTGHRIGHDARAGLDVDLAILQ